MVNYLNLTPGEDQVRQDGFSELNAAEDRIRALDESLGDVLGELEDARATIKAVAQEAFKHWDADREMKVGKLLRSLSGDLIGHYRNDIDEAMGYSESVIEKANGPYVIVVCKFCNKKFQRKEPLFVLLGKPVCPECETGYQDMAGI